MTERRRFFLIAGGFTIGMGLAAACGFPDPELVPDGAGAPDGGDAAADPDGTSDLPDAVAPEAAPPVDASGEKPPVDANCDLCDCDGDGWATSDAGVCADAGTKPRGDCDDYDPRANPDAGYVIETPTPDTRGDWNCDDVVKGQYAGVLVDCSKYQSLGGCNVEGFVGNPGCGQKGTYVFCAPDGLGPCKIGSNEQRTQGCQ